MGKHAVSPGSADMYNTVGNPKYNTNKREESKSLGYGPERISAYAGATAALKGLWDPGTSPPLKPSFYSIRTAI